MEFDKNSWILDLYQEILLEVNIQIKSNELIAMMDEDNARSISESSDETSDCSKKSDSGFDDNDDNDDSTMSGDNGTSGDEDDINEKAENDREAVVENNRTYFKKFVAPSPASLPVPQWCVTNNGEKPGSVESKVNQGSTSKGEERTLTVAEFFKLFASGGTNSPNL